MEKFKLNIASKTLTITAKFAEKMNDPESDEYALLVQFQNDFPGLRIVNRTHRSPRHYTTKSGEKFNCNQFKNLKYENMERFISALPNAEEYQTEYEFIKDYASRVQTNGYALVRRWFVAQFPEFRKNPLFYLYNSPALINGAEFLEAEASTFEKKVA